MVFTVRLAVLWSALGLNVVQGCPNGWESFEGSCYFIPEIKEDWSASSTTCGLYHASLVEITNAREDNFVKHLVSKYHDGYSHDKYFWLGGTDSFVEGDWRWIGSDNLLTYTDWHHGEPNGHHDEDCLLGQLSDDHFDWKDNRCTSKYNFICEIVEDGDGGHLIG
ncbi:perlucin-like protein [Argopecten irradians]|uniref:perlucin-like protein n=1 Tax=Argopecten irradians TaxID=31199 RepID=UPI00371721E5